MIGTHTVVATYNGSPSFLASSVGPLTQKVVGNITLEPLGSTTQGGSSITVYANVTDVFGNAVAPAAGATVTFEVVSGPDVGLTGTAVTGPDGRASYTFVTSPVAGVTKIQAKFNDGSGLLETSNVVSTQVQATPTLAWSRPVDILYGTPLGVLQLDATANVPGVFSYEPKAGTILNVGANQVLTVTFTPSDPSYVPATLSTTINVTPAPLTIKADAASRVYGQANPDFTASFEGFIPGQGPGDLDGAIAFGAPATAASHAGSYAVTVGGLTSENYTITYVPGTLTVTPAPLTIKADDKGDSWALRRPR